LEKATVSFSVIGECASTTKRAAMVHSIDRITNRDIVIIYPNIAPDE
jgi:hypothetical protein